MILSVFRVTIILYETGQLFIGYVVVRGDLETVLKSMTWDSKFKKGELTAMVWEVQDLVKELRDVGVLF